MDKPHVVILGGGFGGLQAARMLARAPVRVTLVDRRNHHLFQPLLYQVATGGLNPADIAYPIRHTVRRQRNIQIVLAEARRVDADAKRVWLADGFLDYDFLIVATGVTHSYFGRDDWSERAPGLKSLEDALEMRRRVFLAYEAAERETDPRAKAEWLTFVVVGAGPTGVELAGTLSEIGRHTLRSDFTTIFPERVRVVLVEGNDRVLSAFPSELCAKARRSLEKLGVEVQTGVRVTDIDDHGVILGNRRVQARTVFWAAGVCGSPLAATLGASLDSMGRVLVAPDLSVPQHPEIFAIGDLAAISHGGKAVPGVAPAAIQGGVHAAKSIVRSLEGKPTQRFRYRDKGALATIGRAAAVAQVGRFKLSGFTAWMMWWAVHIAFLIGFRSRILVMFGWAWSYFTFRRGARLITGEVPPLLGDQSSRSEEH